MKTSAEDTNERGLGFSATKWISGEKVNGGHRSGGGSELLVCFPARTSMSLMPKPILSPGRSGDPAKRLRNSLSRGQSSPMFSIHTTGASSEGRKNSSASYDIEEPSSPKVTCVGQVRVKPKQCKSWQSVMEEIEKLHGQRQQRRVLSRPKGPGAGTPVSSPRRSHHKWSQAFGLKRELLQFMAALRNLRFDFGCFGAPAASRTANSQDSEDEPTTSGSTVFAKWFMILQDNDDDRKRAKSDVSAEEDESEGRVRDRKSAHRSAQSAAASAEDRTDDARLCGSEDSCEEPAIPPPNALLLMRCRSAPSRASSDVHSWNYRDDDDPAGTESDSVKAQGSSKKSTGNAVVLMRYESDFSKLSLEVSKETWFGRRDFINQSFMRSVSLKG